MTTGMRATATQTPLSSLLVVSTADRRGAEVFAESLAVELARRTSDARVVALAPARTGQRIDAAVLGSSRHDPRAMARLVRAARRHDVVVSNGGTTLLPVAIAAAIARRPFVYRNIGDPTVWGAARWANLRIGTPLRRAAGIAALYPVAATEIAQRYGVDSDRIMVIPNAAPAEQFDPVTDDMRAAARAELDLADDRLWIGYVGALSGEKNPIAAIRAVLSEPRLGLVVAGDGPLGDECRLLAAEAPDAIRLLGSLRDVTPVYAAVDAVVIPSRTEGIPGVAIEAGMSGLGVVATDVGGMSHVVVDGSTGRLLDDPSATDLAAALVDVAERRTQFGAAATAHCHAEFSMTQVAARWAELLRRVVATRRRASADR